MKTLSQHRNGLPVEIKKQEFKKRRKCGSLQEQINDNGPERQE
jgi:hypothetical protein